MAKITIEFEFGLPEGTTQEQVQKQVDGLLDDCRDGRFPWAVETLERVGFDILHEAVLRACRSKFAAIHGNEHRVVETASGSKIYVYKCDELAEELVKSTDVWPRLIREGFYRTHDD